MIFGTIEKFMINKTIDISLPKSKQLFYEVQTMIDDSALDDPGPELLTVNYLKSTSGFRAPIVRSKFHIYLNSRGRWTPVSTRVHVHVTVFQKFRVHVHVTIFQKFRVHVNVHVTIF